MKHGSIAPALLSCVLLAGCGGTSSPTSPSQATTAPTLSRTRFLAFGDSITLGELTAPIGQLPRTLTHADAPSLRLALVPGTSYPSQLLSLLTARYTSQSGRLAVMNAGKSAEYAYEGAARFAETFEAAQADVVLLLEGVNGLTIHGTDLGLLALAEMTDAAKNRGARVFLATLPPIRSGGRNTTPPALLAQMNAGIRRVASAEGAVLVEIHDGMLAEVNTLIGIDGLHPNELGYQRMADLFFAAIRSELEQK